MLAEAPPEVPDAMPFVWSLRHCGWAPDDGIIGFPESVAGRHLGRPFHGSLRVQACDFASVPFGLRVAPDALDLGYRTSTTKALEGLTPPRHRTCQAYIE
jgi:hypothetical protein